MASNSPGKEFLSLTTRPSLHGKDFLNESATFTSKYLKNKLGNPAVEICTSIRLEKLGYWMNAPKAVKYWDLRRIFDMEIWVTPSMCWCRRTKSFYCSAILPIKLTFFWFTHAYSKPDTFLQSFQNVAITKVHLQQGRFDCFRMWQVISTSISYK